MAEKTVRDTEKYPVDLLRKELQVPDAVHAGTCIREGWNRGKEVTRKEYSTAVERFRGAAGRKGHA